MASRSEPTPAGGADTIVVGAGSAGCVLAARLSQDPDREVLLLEAGPDYPTRAALPPEIADGTTVAETHDWGYASEPGTSGRTISLLRARLVGGCAATNGTFAVRGCPADYDAWAAAGNPGWSFDDLLPVFRAMETDLDFGSDAWHGSQGPLPIRRYPPEETSAPARAFLEAAVTSGHAEVADHNRPNAVGAGPLPVNTVDGVRMSTALAYLEPARPRPNLTVRADTLIDRVELRRGRAVDVGLAGGDLLAADTVVLAAGTYASPAILLRSGVGPAGKLASLGVEVALDLPGVGSGLIDHPLASVDVPVRGDVLATGKYQTLLTWRHERAGGGHDLQLFAAGPFPADGGAVMAIGFSHVTPRSRGRVRLRSPDPAHSPRIDPAYLHDAADVEAMLAGLIQARRLARTEPLKELIVGDELAPAPGVPDGDTEALTAALRQRVSTYHHPVGTCAMGPDPDAGAVVDARGRVDGLEGLYVADAAVMPDIPAANTNLPTIAVAERLAGWLRHEGVS